MNRDAVGQREQGFTLIELLVVVLIIGILAAIAVPTYLDQRKKAFREAVRADVRNAAMVLEDYETDHFGGLTDLAVVGFGPSEGVSLTLNQYGDGYCLEGLHDAFGTSENWIFNATGGVATASVVAYFSGGTGTCPASPTSSATVTG